MGLAEKVAPFVRHDRDIRLYAGFFVTRSQCEALDMHCDWATEETDAFTLMAPLRPNGSDLGRTYDTVRGTRRTLTYRLGKGLVFGPKFFHSAAVGKLDERAVFLCFNFGTDRMENWPTISKTVAMRCDPCAPTGRQLYPACRMAEHPRQAQRLLISACPAACAPTPGRARQSYRDQHAAGPMAGWP